MKPIFTLFLFILSQWSFSQEKEVQKVDYDLIEQHITDSESPFHYPKLMTRYRNGDSTLTVEDYRHLYYGFTFQENYQPYERYPLDAKISKLMGNMNKENLQKLRELAHQYLQEKPFSLKIIDYLKNFNLNLMVRGENELLERQYNGIVSAILSSGDGRSLETAYSVNHPSDEYMVMRSLGLKPTQSSFHTAYDLFAIAENEDNIDSLYFDIYRMAKVGTSQMGIEKKTVQKQDTLPEDGILIGTKDELQEFIQPGYNLLFHKMVDYDQDGDDDWVIITKKEGEEALSNFANNDPELRILKILQRNNDKSLEVAVQNKMAIPCIDCGYSSDDPFIDLKVEPGVLQLSTKGGKLFQWERTTRFELTNQQWQLVREEFTSYRRGKKEETKTTDVETVDDFGKVLLEEFNFYELLE